MRANFLPDPRLAALRFPLLERMEQMTEVLEGLAFQGILTAIMKQLMDEAFTRTGAHEGTLWIVDRKAGMLVPVFNTGPDADKLVGHFQQPLNTGIVSMVLANEQPFSENRVYQNEFQDPALDRMLAVKTFAMMAVPFRFGGKTQGVISCVQLRRSEDMEDPTGFAPKDISVLRLTSEVLTVLVDHQLLTAAIGVES